jgi:hypothetical protein
VRRNRKRLLFDRHVSSPHFFLITNR